eukprot:TRINITY_DN16794_c0_g1_i1.p1 TRINITY_DN16794_c0_g1~~TRINITY_DN16794_c0_g1_i1.p1  ORF type:complete len:331 (-),score=36.77 TRINITY_DN16794_c0_g1_i1:95-1087(-)
MLVWIVFGIIVTVSFVLDVGLCNNSKDKNAGNLTIKQALALSLVWVLTAFAFNVGLYYSHGHVVALEFLASYLLEKGLSIDNVFVFYIIFEQFQVPERYQRRVLQWGIIGALAMRAVFITTGIQLLERFHFVIWIFGGLLVVTGLRLLVDDDDDSDNFQDKWFIRLAKKYVPYVDDFGNGKFFVGVMTNKTSPPSMQLHATRLFFTLLCVEIMDAVFALDSIPAILSLTHDPLVVYTSNIFAILGLRALYFAISGMVHQFYYLKHGLAIILIFVGVKMLIANYYKVDLVVALLFIMLVMATSVVASMLVKHEPKERPQMDEENEEEMIDL